MKKNLIYVAIAVVLALVVGYLVTKNNNQYAVGDDQNFNTPNVTDLERIYIAAKDGRTIKLDKQDDGHWIVNDSFMAMQAKVDLLLGSLKGLVIYAPVADAARDNVVKELATHGLKVELYDDADDEPFKVYFLGKPNQAQEANNMLMQIDGKSARTPYLVHIPGFIGDLQTRFLLNTSDWRDLNVFDYKLDEIKQVKYVYHDVPAASFTLTVEGDGNFTLQHPDNNTPAPQNLLFKAGINKFLDSFVNLNAEAVTNEFAFKDSVLNGPKFATITVLDMDGKSSELMLYRMHANRRTKTLFDGSGNEITYDPDHYYALFNNGKDFGIVQHFVFGKVLRRYEEFILNNKGENNPL